MTWSVSAARTRAYQACSSGAVADRAANGAPTESASMASSQGIGAPGSGSPSRPLRRSGSTRAASKSTPRWMPTCRRSEPTR